SARWIPRWRPGQWSMASWRSWRPAAATTRRNGCSGTRSTWASTPPSSSGTRSRPGSPRAAAPSGPRPRPRRRRRSSGRGRCACPPRPRPEPQPLGTEEPMTEEAQIHRARVWVANVNPGSVSTDFADSLTALVLADVTNGWGCFQGKLEARSGSNISKGRNELVARFLDKTDGEWLLFIDSDMVFPEDTIVRLLAAAQAAGTKIISGLCVMVTGDGPIPTLYLPAEGENEVTRVMLNAPDDQVMQVFATGAACLMIHRDVFEEF